MRITFPKAFARETSSEHNLSSKFPTRSTLVTEYSAPVTHLLEEHLPGHINPFSPIVTRDFRPPKPSPAGILHIAHAWGVADAISDAEDLSEDRLLPLLMVGDSIDDMIAGRNAGALTVLLRSEGKEELERDPRTDVVIGRLDELIQLLDQGLSARSN